MERGSPLPVLAVLGEALSDVFGNLGGLVRIAWPYYALAAVLVLVGSLAFGGAEGGAAGSLMEAFGAGTAGIVVSLGVPACMVQWQRHVVLGEALDRMAPLTGRVLRYILWSVALGLIAAAPGLAMMALGLATGLIVRPGDGETPFGIGVPGILLLAIGGLAGMYLFVRLALVLPAVSVEDRRMGLGGSLAATRGHGLHLLALAVLAVLGLGLFGAAVGLVTAALTSAFDPQGAGALVVVAALDSIIDLVSAILGAAVGAVVYRRLVPAPAPAPASAASPV